MNFMRYLPNILEDSLTFTVSFIPVMWESHPYVIAKVIVATHIASITCESRESHNKLSLIPHPNIPTETYVLLTTSLLECLARSSPLTFFVRMSLSFSSVGTKMILITPSSTYSRTKELRMCWVRQDV